MPSSRSSLDDIKLQFGQARGILLTSCYLDNFKILICFFGQFSLLFFCGGNDKKKQKTKALKTIRTGFPILCRGTWDPFKNKTELRSFDYFTPLFFRDIYFFLKQKNTQKEISNFATWKWLPTNDLSSILFLIGSKVPPKKRESPWGWVSYTKKRPIQFEFFQFLIYFEFLSYH